MCFTVQLGIKEMLTIPHVDEQKLDRTDVTQYVTENVSEYVHRSPRNNFPKMCQGLYLGIIEGWRQSIASYNSS